MLYFESSHASWLAPLSAVGAGANARFDGGFGVGRLGSVEGPHWSGEWVIALDHDTALRPVGTSPLAVRKPPLRPVDSETATSKRSRSAVRPVTRACSSLITALKALDKLSSISARSCSLRCSSTSSCSMTASRLPFLGSLRSTRFSAANCSILSRKYLLSFLACFSCPLTSSSSSRNAPASCASRTRPSAASHCASIAASASPRLLSLSFASIGA
mmetsp:Transcript_56895/g.130669  ORF Transcript_56895/g.130669 Transcript_56895/m.130669 type:complete len:216 (-) Transcript_56895:734-1381(-)